MLISIACNHVKRGMVIKNVTKVLEMNPKAVCMSPDDATNVHLHEKPYKVWMCLGCGALMCGPPSDYFTHSHQHMHECRHYIAVQINTLSLWCYICKDEVDSCNTKTFKVCLQKIKQHFNPKGLCKNNVNREVEVGVLRREKPSNGDSFPLHNFEFLVEEPASQTCKPTLGHFFTSTPTNSFNAIRSGSLVEQVRTPPLTPPTLSLVSPESHIAVGTLNPDTTSLLQASQLSQITWRQQSCTSENTPTSSPVQKRKWCRKSDIKKGPRKSLRKRKGHAKLGEKVETGIYKNTRSKSIKQQSTDSTVPRAKYNTRSSSRLQRTDEDDLIQSFSTLAISATGITGLKNLGNTCFLNAILQCLAQTPFLLSLLLQSAHGQKFHLPGDPVNNVLPFDGKTHSWGPITFNLAHIMARLLEKQDFFSSNSVNPIELINALRKCTTTINFEAQQDAQELFDFLLNAIEEEQRMMIIQEIDRFQKDTNNSSQTTQLYHKQATELLLQPCVIFQGTLITHMECSLQTTQSITEKFMNLSLPLVPQVKHKDHESSEQHSPGDQEQSMMTDDQLLEKCEYYSRQHHQVRSFADLNPAGNALNRLITNTRMRPIPKPAKTVVKNREQEKYSVESCLENFTAQETVQYDCKCGNGPETIHTRKVVITHAPAVLVIHLKRFQRTSLEKLTKLTTPVTFTQLLNLTPFCDPSCQRGGKVIYSLFGVVVHSGSLNRGHYEAYIKIRQLAEHQSQFLLQPEPLELSVCNTDQANDQWYHANDTFVTRVSESHVLKQEAYILFYERIQ